MSIWSENEFPCMNVELGNYDNWIGKNRKLSGKSNAWNSKNRKPFCWTPAKRFYFGDKEFIPLYPCIAFETRNFGYVIQRRWDGLVSGRE